MVASKSDSFRCNNRMPCDVHARYPCHTHKHARKPNQAKPNTNASIQAMDIWNTHDWVASLYSKYARDTWPEPTNHSRLVNQHIGATVRTHILLYEKRMYARLQFAVYHALNNCRVTRCCSKVQLHGSRSVMSHHIHSILLWIRVLRFIHWNSAYTLSALPRRNTGNAKAAVLQNVVKFYLVFFSPSPFFCYVRFTFEHFLLSIIS